MKTILGLLIAIASFSSFQSKAATTVTLSNECKSQLESVLTKKTGFNAEVLYVGEVGPGYYYTEHFILFAPKNVGGILYRAIGMADVGSCPTEITSVKKAYTY